MSTCPFCARTDGQVKAGRNPSGSQRSLCKPCRRRYTPERQPQGYDEPVRRQAVRLSVDGLNLRRIARQLGVVHQTVANWVAARAATLPDTPPAPPTSAQAPVAVAELDELSTFAGEKKTASPSSRP
jgi:transposase-like protein